MMTIRKAEKIAKIELLEAPSRERSDLGTNNREPLAMTSNNSISAAKLLENVEKSYDKGKFILNKSKNTILVKILLKDNASNKKVPKKFGKLELFVTFAL